jgi:outer membrane protein assembly factor BamB
MVYDREKVKQTLAGRTDPEGLFARAELATGESRLKQAAELMVTCLDTISSEDLDFRATVNQQLYKVHKELARAGIRGGDPAAELAHCVGMSRTVTSLADEVETLFAVAQAYERRGDFATAARQFQSIANIYGQYEYPVPEIMPLDAARVSAEANRVLSGSQDFAGNPFFDASLRKGIELMRRTLPVYRSAVSPLPKTLSLRAGELSAAGLVQLQKASPDFAREFEKAAQATIGDKPAAEQLVRLWEFPGTPTAQSVVEKLLGEADKRLRDPGSGLAEQADLRRRLWALADTARIGGLSIPDAFRARLLAPPEAAPNAALGLPMETRTQDMEEARGTAWLVLERKGERTVRPDLMFLGGRVKKKFDNKFLLYCLNAASGEVVWKAQEKRGDTWFDEIRLQGKGDEPGFFEAFVHGDIVVVHGMFDVLAFELKDGKLLWRYEVPFAFEIKRAIKSGDLLVLAGQAETVALVLPTKDPRGEVAWQEKEEGDLYIDPYFHGDRLVSLRKSPSNLTMRYRSTGKLMGRLALPDLLLEDTHPLIENGPRELPAARHDRLLAVTDGWYTIMLDVEKMAVAWKRLIDANDVTKLPAMRLALEGDYLAVVKQDYDVKTIYMLSSKTGEILWRTDPKVPGSPQPIHSLVMRDGKLYGILPHPGQAFHFAGLDCKTGKNLFGPNEQKGYGGKPEAALMPDLHGDHAVALVKDRQDYEVKAFDLKDGKLLHTLKSKSTGDFGEHGRASAAAQNGKLVLLGKNELITGLKK